MLFYPIIQAVRFAIYIAGYGRCSGINISPQIIIHNVWLKYFVIVFFYGLFYYCLKNVIQIFCQFSKSLKRIYYVYYINF